MEKTHSSPFAFLFPWLSPLVITFTLTHGGIEIQLYKNERLISKEQTARLRKLLPEPLLQWMDDQQLFVGPQPYPLARQVWQNLLPLVSKKLIINAAGLAELKESSQPQNVSLVWELSCAEGAIKGRYEGVDHYLGMGWFHKGTTLWSLPRPPSNAIDLQLKNLTLPVQQVDMLLNPIMPSLQQHLSTRADFQVISDFKIQVDASVLLQRALTLALNCNYPQLLPTLQIPEQQIDILFAKQALIRFPQQALTPIIKQWLQQVTPATLQGTDIPLFIREQLPIMHQYGQISDEAATQIIKTYPIVSLASVQPSPIFAHSYENGIGKYITQATYRYQNQTLDVPALLTAYQKQQRFVYQHATWFEWPANARALVNTMQQQLSTQLLRPEEVMGFDTRRVAFLQKPLPAATIRPDGDTPFKRGQSLFEQLRRHGIAGGIIGEPAGLRAMFADACEHLVRDNRQAHILWIAPSNKKGAATRAVNESRFSSSVTVASLVTLRDEPALFLHPWTLVIFQELDHLLDRSIQANRLSQLKWQWALASVTSQHSFSAAAMHVLHISEHYQVPFCARYLFDLEKSYPQVVVDQSVSHNAQPAAPLVSKNEPARSTTAPPASTTQTPRTTPHSQEAFRELDAATQSRIEEQKAEAQRRLEEQKIAAQKAAISQTPNVTLIWKLNRSALRIEGRFEGADRYLGAGRFQQGTKIWSLKQNPPGTIDDILRNPIIPLQRADSSLNSIIPALQAYIPTRADFQIITDFRVQVDASVTRQGSLTLALHCNYPLLLPTLQVPEQKVDVLFANQALIHFPRQALTPVIKQLLQKSGSITIQGADIPLFIREQLPVLRQHRQIDDATAALITKAHPIVSIATLKPIPSFTYAQKVPSPTRQHIKLDQQRVVKLHKESEYLQERLTVEEEAEETPVLPFEPEIAPAAPVAKLTTASAPEVDEDWQLILQAWKAEHWEVLTLLYQGKANQLVEVARKVHRPLSQLIDEINAPVDDLLSDLLVDPDTHTFASHLLENTVKLVHWHTSSTGESTKPANVLPEYKKLVEEVRQESTKVASELVPAPPVRPQQPTKAAPEPVPAPPARPQQPAKPLAEKAAPERASPSPEPTPQAAISLDPEAISKLHEGADHLYKRLAPGDEAEETPGSLLEPEMAPAAPVANMTTASAPEVDEDWQLIQQAWKAEHWEVLTLLYQGHTDQLAEVARKAHRPLSQLIDEINAPVDDQLGDLLVDPSAHTIASHLLEETEKLVYWHISYKGR